MRIRWVVTIHKNNGDIIILNITYKLSTIIQGRLRKEADDIIGEYQSSSKKRKSIINAIHRLK